MCKSSEGKWKRPNAEARSLRVLCFLDVLPFLRAAARNFAKHCCSLVLSYS